MNDVKLYYSIRVVCATTHEEAIDKVIEQEFEESDDICDRVLTRSELLETLNKRSG